MLRKRLRLTGVLVALCLAMPAASAHASAPSDPLVDASHVTKPHADGIIAILIGAIAPKGG
jgi:hypothetical protein